MKLRTVKDLRGYLENRRLSPERLADQCGISNMTIRRWLRTDDSRAIPQKYWPIFDQTLYGASDLNASFMHGFDDLEKHVFQLGSERQPNVDELQAEAQKKIDSFGIVPAFQERVRSLFSSLKSGELTEQARTLVYGALIYFLNPMDFVPDMTPVIGLLDDYSVVSMALSSLRHAQK